MGFATGDVRIGSGLGGRGFGPPGGGPPDSGGGDSRDWPPGFTGDDSMLPQRYRIGIWLAIAAIVMLFAALASAYIIRQRPPERNDIPSDWTWIEMPSVLWFNTAVLIVSGLTMEHSRRLLKRNEYRRFSLWITLTTLLGFLFLAGQVFAWQQFRRQGAYSTSSPHGWFFYLFTGLHAVHLLGGILALLYVTTAALRLRIGLRRRAAVDVTATYWHFMDALWVFIFLLLFFWR